MLSCTKMSPNCTQQTTRCDWIKRKLVYVFSVQLHSINSCRALNPKRSTYIHPDSI